MSDNDDYEAKIAALRAQREELARKREERAAADEKRMRLEREQRALTDEHAIAKAEEEIGAGKFTTVSSPLGIVILKRPSHMHHRRFMSLKEATADDVEKHVLTTLVHPSRAAFQTIIEEYPGILLEAASKLIDLAAGRATEVQGKS